MSPVHEGPTMQMQHSSGPGSSPAPAPPFPLPLLPLPLLLLLAEEPLSLLGPSDSAPLPSAPSSAPCTSGALRGRRRSCCTCREGPDPSAAAAAACPAAAAAAASTRDAPDASATSALCIDCISSERTWAQGNSNMQLTLSPLTPLVQHSYQQESSPVGRLAVLCQWGACTCTLRQAHHHTAGPPAAAPRGCAGGAGRAGPRCRRSAAPPVQSAAAPRPHPRWMPADSRAAPACRTETLLRVSHPFSTLRRCPGLAEPRTLPRHFCAVLAPGKEGRHLALKATPTQLLRKKRWPSPAHLRLPESDMPQGARLSTPCASSTVQSVSRAAAAAAAAPTALSEEEVPAPSSASLSRSRSARLQQQQQRQMRGSDEQLRSSAGEAHFTQ